MLRLNERPIERPRVQRAKPGEHPGWQLILTYEGRPTEPPETWQRWEDAAMRALLAAGPPEGVELAAWRARLTTYGLAAPRRVRIRQFVDWYGAGRVWHPLATELTAKDVEL